MKLIADTHVLLRSVVADDEAQSARAIQILEEADRVIVSLQTLCELVRVLDRSYGAKRADIAAPSASCSTPGPCMPTRPPWQQAWP